MWAFGKDLELTITQVPLNYSTKFHLPVIYLKGHKRSPVLYQHML